MDLSPPEHFHRSYLSALPSSELDGAVNKIRVEVN